MKRPRNVEELRVEYHRMLAEMGWLVHYMELEKDQEGDQVDMAAELFELGERLQKLWYDTWGDGNDPEWTDGREVHLYVPEADWRSDMEIPLPSHRRAARGGEA